MPAKLDRCVKKVESKGNSRSSAFAICNKSLGLTKTAVTAALVRKIFDKRYAIEKGLKNYAKYHPNQYSYAGEASATKARHLIRANKLRIKGAENMTNKASDFLRNMKKMDANKAKYGVRNPGLATIAKKNISNVVSPIKEKIKSGLSSVFNGKKVQPAYGMAR